jgi:hypothetical protein
MTNSANDSLCHAVFGQGLWLLGLSWSAPACWRMVVIISFLNIIVFLFFDDDIHVILVVEIMTIV